MELGRWWVRIGAMPTVPRRLAAQQERDRLQARRLRAAELFTAGVRQAQVARQLGVSAQAVSVWHARWQRGGPEALHSRGPSGPPPRLSDAELAIVEQALLEGATANGFTGELWTLERIALVVERLTGVRYHPARVWALLHHRLGWTVQRPKRRAAERDQAAIDRWVKGGLRGGGAQLAFHITAGNDDTDTLIEVLGELRRFLGGEKATLLWDGLPAHRSIERVRQTPYLAYSFLRRTGLSVS